MIKNKWAFLSGMALLLSLNVSGCGGNEAKVLSALQGSRNSDADYIPTNTPPFAGSNVRCQRGAATVSVLKSAVTLKNGIHFTTKTFSPVESWTGRIQGNPFVLTVYQGHDDNASNRLNQSIVLAESYNGKIMAAFSPGYGNFTVRNFTANYVVGQYPAAGWLALNLTTGSVSYGEAAVHLSGFRPKDPNAGPIKGPQYVLGLPKRYSIP